MNIINKLFLAALLFGMCAQSVAVNVPAVAAASSKASDTLHSVEERATELEKVLKVINQQRTQCYANVCETRRQLLNRWGINHRDKEATEGVYTFEKAACDRAHSALIRIMNRAPTDLLAQFAESVERVGNENNLCIRGAGDTCVKSIGYFTHYLDDQAVRRVYGHEVKQCYARWAQELAR